MPMTRLHTKGSFASDPFGQTEGPPVTPARPPGAAAKHSQNTPAKILHPSTGKCGASHNRRLLDESN